MIFTKDFDFGKCTRATFVSGKLSYTVSITLDIKCTIKELDTQRNYKKIGITEGDSIHYGTIDKKK